MTLIKSPINYTGNKFKILPDIKELLPKQINTFVDVFGGSGTVTLNVSANKYIYNDFNKWVVDMFDGLINGDTIQNIADIDSIIAEYNLSKENQEGYLRLRDDYNNGRNDWKTLYTLCCYAFNSQGRFNRYGKFNMPFGKDRSSCTDIQRRNIWNIRENVGDGVVVCLNKSFDEIDFSQITTQDFVYFDPPYWGSDAVYNEQDGWTEQHEKKLYDLLIKLNDRGIKWMLSNNLKYGNPYLQKLCDTFNCYHIGSHYSNSSYNKKDRTEDDEVIVINYGL